MTFDSINSFFPKAHLRGISRPKQLGQWAPEAVKEPLNNLKQHKGLKVCFLLPARARNKTRSVIKTLFSEKSFVALSSKQFLQLLLTFNNICVGFDIAPFYLLSFKPTRKLIHRTWRRRIELACDSHARSRVSSVLPFMYNHSLHLAEFFWKHLWKLFFVFFSSSPSPPPKKKYINIIKRYWSITIFLFRIANFTFICRIILLACLYS